jgi:hypothetical protein
MRLHVSAGSGTEGLITPSMDASTTASVISTINNNFELTLFLVVAILCLAFVFTLSIAVRR